MSRNHIIRAWKDADFRNSLSDQERALLPEHPAGLIELADTELEAAAGGGFPLTLNADFRGRKMTHTFPHTLAEVMGT